MKSDPKVTRAFLKLVIALKSHPDWDRDELLVRAAASQGVDAEELRTYATARMGLPDMASATDLVTISARDAEKGR